MSWRFYLDTVPGASADGAAVGGRVVGIPAASGRDASGASLVGTPASRILATEAGAGFTASTGTGALLLPQAASKIGR